MPLRPRAEIGTMFAPRMSSLWPVLAALALARGPAALARIQDEGSASDAPQAQVRPGGAAASSRADYEIRARLDPVELALDGVAFERFQLEGSERIRWTNGSADSVSELRFHLYLNAFANNRSTHMLETSGDGRRREGSEPSEEWWWGWQEVRSVSVGGSDVTASARYVRSEPGGEEGTLSSADDRTVLAVDTGRPIEPGETVAIDLTWESLLPRVRRRTGTKDDFLFVAQWFPKIGVYESGRGWNCHPFHGVTEFYADYGTYRVTLDLPRAYSDRVGGSGVRTQNLVQGADRVEVVFEAPSVADRERADGFGKRPLVHDFAWTGDPDFVVYTNTFRPAEWMQEFPEEVQRAQAAFGADVDLGLRDVAVTVLLQPEHEGQAKRHFRATCAALFFYGLWFGGYPYEHVTAVDPAWGGGGAAGMEYPTLFTCGTRLFTTPDMHSPESVTIHECGHQFWYGLVGNNEFEAAWLDEGFNSFTDSEVLARVYGPTRRTTDYVHLPHDGIRFAPAPDGGRLARVLAGRDWSLGFLKGRGALDRLSGTRIDPLRASGVVEWWRDQPLLSLAPSYEDPRWSDRAGYLRDPDSDPVERSGWQYVDRASYRTNSYPRTGAVLRSLIGVVGREAFLRGMRHYAGAWRYRHPYPDDFYASFIEGAGVDVRWYFEDCFQSTKTIDWSVEVTERSAPEEEGYFLDPAGKLEERRPRKRGEEVASTDAGEGMSAVQSDAETDAGGPSKGPHRFEIVLRREGELCLPLSWQVRIETEPDGESGEAPAPADEVRDFVWTREEQLACSWKRTSIELPHHRRVKSVVLDPARLYYLDRNMADNQWYAERDHVTPLRWSERVFQQYQQILHWYTGIGG